MLPKRALPQQYSICLQIYPFTRRGDEDSSKLKEFADDKLIVAQMVCFVFDSGKKQCGERNKCLLLAFSSLLTKFSKDVLLVFINNLLRIAGHYNTLTSCMRKMFWICLAVCGRALSCWKIPTLCCCKYGTTTGLIIPSRQRNANVGTARFQSSGV